MVEKKLFVVCLHGDEQAGLAAIDAAKSLHNSNLKFIIGNPEAVKRNVRFIDADLNRVFPGKNNGNYEERRAAEIKRELDGYDVVVDLHTSSRETPSFAITTKISPESIRLVKSLGLNKLVIMHPDLAKGNSLIDCCKCGVSVELGKHNSDETKTMAKQIVTNFSNGFVYEDLEIFKAVRILKKPAGKFVDFLKNFELVKAGTIIAKSIAGDLIVEADFYPVLSGEGDYTEMLCLACEKLTNSLNNPKQINPHG